MYYPKTTWTWVLTEPWNNTMPEKDAFADRKRNIEEDYFRKKEKELIEKMRRHAALQAERQEIARAIGVADETLLNELQDLGYTLETITLLHLVPLVQVAWVEGGVDKEESKLIYEVARLRGIEEGSPAYRQLTEWLKRRPSEQFFQKTLRAIRAMLQSLPPEEQEASKRDLVSYCTRIAAASGGILGLGRKTSAEEKALLSKIASALERSHESAAKEVIDEV